jgi:hypothetical protein
VAKCSCCYSQIASVEEELVGLLSQASCIANNCEANKPASRKHSIEVKHSSISEAGMGLWVKGSLGPGSLICIYPGEIRSKTDAKVSVLVYNSKSQLNVFLPALVVNCSFRRLYGGMLYCQSF